MARGLLTREQLRSSTWRRVFRGIYADAQLPDDHGLRARAAMLLIPPGAAITGRSAAWLWGARIATSLDPVDVVAPLGSRFKGFAGLETRTAPIPEDEVTTLDGVRLTLPLRTAWEVAIRMEPVEAITILDALTGIGQLTVEQLKRYLATKPGHRNARSRAAQIFSLVDYRSGSPDESRLRARLILAGLPVPIPQYEYRFWDGSSITLSLAWPEERVAIRYGETNPTGRYHVENVALTSAGWLVYRVTDINHGIEALITALRYALHTRARKKA